MLRSLGSCQSIQATGACIVGKFPNDLVYIIQRYSKTFQVGAVICPESDDPSDFGRRWQDMCWALHSDCQSTIVDHILEAGIRKKPVKLRCKGLSIPKSYSTASLFMVCYEN